MEKIEILLVEDDLIICEEMTEEIANSDDMLLVATTNNSNTAINYIKDYMPDAVILDLELHEGEGNGLNVLQEIRSLDLTKIPYILITTNNSSTTTHEIARSLGADFIMSKHQENYSTKSVLDFLRIIRPAMKNVHKKSNTFQNNASETPEQHNRRITRRIMTELNHVGINPKSKGYTYLIDAISIITKEKQSTQNITHLIADKYKSSPLNVERAMQNAINRAWKSSSIDDLLNHYTAKINSEKGMPTITEFICYYANKLKNEY